MPSYTICKCSLARRDIAYSLKRYTAYTASSLHDLVANRMSCPTGLHDGIDVTIK